MHRRELRLLRALARAVTTAAAALSCGCQAEGAGAPRDAGPEREADARDPCAPEDVDGAGLDPDVDGCVTYRALPCGIPADAQVENCVLQDLEACIDTCVGTVLYCQVPSALCTPEGTAVRDAAAILECVSCGIAGRPPRGLVSPRAPGPTEGAIFAAMAHLEAASVRAFEDLDRALEALDAPRALRRAASRAADDERRHARIASRLARAHGRDPARVEIRPVPPPSLVDLLVDDAVGGCVGETFGALLLAWQARHAEGARSRRTFAAIARDEARHAALAWAILDWGLPRLDARGRRRVARAMARAVGAVGRDEGPITDRARRVTGLPCPEGRRRLVRELGAIVKEEAEICMVT